MGNFTNLAQQVMQQQSQLAQQRANQANSQQDNSTAYQNPTATLLAPPQAMPARTGYAQTPQQQLVGQMMLQGMGGLGLYGGY
jgi:hypothetical protein